MNSYQPAPARMAIAVSAAHFDLAYIHLRIRRVVRRGIHRIGCGAYQRIHTPMDDFGSPDYEFGGFRLDTAQQVLISCTGEPLPLPSRAFATLRYLVERSGEIADKAAIMAAVWPKAVVAENNLSQCILALRKALGDSPIERRFILTVPGRGYKFVAPVTVVPHMRSVPAASPALPIRPITTRNPHRRRWMAAAGTGALVAVGAVLWLWRARAHPVTVPAEYEQLTDVTDTATAPVLSPDGHMLAFIRGGGPYRGTGQIWLKVLPNGEAVQLTDAPGPVWAPAFTPDSARVLFTTINQQHGSWDTWSVPVTGRAEATMVLPNAQALSYIGPREVMYSEFDVGLHAGLATSLDDRSLHRKIYAPIHEHGMARFSYLSPDRKSVLVSEMAASDGFARCRLVPFDGTTVGYAVGPLDGGCISAAWSPDGQWMYFSSSANGVNHLWRQRYPNGEIEQITFGPNEEQTVFATPDGHALLTAIGRTQSSLWIHNANGERALTTEGRVSSPWLSADARHVYFLIIRSEEHGRSLARMDIGTGSQESLLPGFDITEYDVSPDERQVVFVTLREGMRQIWLAPLDRLTPPRLLVRSADEPAFGGGYVFFRHIGGHANYLHRIKTDGSSGAQLLPDPIVQFNAVAPDGKAVIATRPSADNLIDVWAIPVDSASPARVINRGYSPSHWSLDGRTLYVGLNIQERVALAGSTAVLPTGPDDLPLTPLLAATAGARLIPHQEEGLWVGPDPSVYVFLKTELRQNIYRIPLH
jgi:DNA-binding winged helix-turn-helix (wHTH) protein/Tol biopolymer transport system component